MKIAALLKFSTLDYPGKLSAVVFCQGCPIRCKYCHNEDLLDPSQPGKIEFEDVITFLNTRKGLLDAVVFCGGEPLLQPDLYNSIKTIKSLGFSTGIHTAGTIPDKFEKILSIIDWVGFDIKTSFESYKNVTQVENSGNLAKISFEKLLSSGVDYELRTTYDPRNISRDDMITIAKTLRNHEVKKWVIQECILRNTPQNKPLRLPSDDIVSNISQYINIEIRRE